MRPRDPEDRRITLTAGQDSMIFWFAAGHPARASSCSPACRPGGGGGTMRGLRSLPAAPRRRPRARRLHLLRRIEARAGGGHDKDKVFTVEADKIDEITVKSESGEQHDAEEDRDRLADRRAGRRRARQRRGLGHHHQPDVARVAADDRREPRATSPSTAWTQPRIEVAFKSGGQEKKLLIGRKTPPGDRSLRARLADEPRVFLISSFLDSPSTRRPSTCATRPS